jgi:hypothetical protein
MSSKTQIATWLLSVCAYSKESPAPSRVARVCCDVGVFVILKSLAFAADA